MGTSNFDEIVATTVTAAIVGAVTGNVTGDLTGDATGAINYTSVARTATADGTGTGTIADSGLIQFVAVTSASADNIVVLPTPTPGTIVVLYVGANGFELRTDTPPRSLSMAAPGRQRKAQ